MKNFSTVCVDIVLDYNLIESTPEQAFGCVTQWIATQQDTFKIMAHFRVPCLPLVLFLEI